MPGFSAAELTRGVKDEAAPYYSEQRGAEGNEEEEEEADGWCEVLVMGGDMLVYASGGVLPATRHRVTPTWDRAASVRFSLIAGLYGADTALLEPARFREEICGLEPWAVRKRPFSAPFSCAKKRSQLPRQARDTHGVGKSRGKGGVAFPPAAGLPTGDECQGKPHL